MEWFAVPVVVPRSSMYDKNTELEAQLMKTFRRSLYAALVAGATLVHPQISLSQEPALEEVVVTGTRAPGRSAEDLPVPVDVLTNQELEDTGQTELGRMIQALAPSFNFSTSAISDGTDALRPATLRGLGPDQTLVLINGKRRHQASLIHVNTSVGRGTAGTDMNAIPAAAVRRVEVLRDGAAAQYGSDAIAGVINIVLKDYDHGGRAYASYGETTEEDGETYNLDLNAGTPLGGGGFLNLTFNYRDRGWTDRAGKQGNCVYGGCEDTNGDGIDEPGDPREVTFDRNSFRIGDAESEQYAFVANALYGLGRGEVYGFVTYSTRDNESAAFYRDPVSGEDAYLADGDNVIPNGFLPRINSQIDDYSADIGYQIDFDNGLNFDLSYTWGENTIDYTTKESVNYSFVNFLRFGEGLSDSAIREAIPRQADAYDLELGLQTLNLDMSQGFGDLAIAFGAEFRIDEYKIKSGDEYSYLDYDTVNGQPIYPQDAAGGIQGFPGIAPLSEVDEDRDVYSAYVDAEYEFTADLLVAAALRYDDYDDFGDTINYKVAANWGITDNFRLRGAINTGFRAPSMQQQYFNNVSTQFVENPDDPDGPQVPVEIGTFRNDSELAREIGIPQLEEEESLNYSAGIVWNPTDNIAMTLDYYYIEIDNRIVISNRLEADDDPTGNLGRALQAAGAGAAQFFLNGADTETEGVDLVLTWGGLELLGGSLDMTLAGNYTETDVTDIYTTGGLAPVAPDVVFSSQQISIIETWQPKDRLNWMANWRRGGFLAHIMINRYGEYTVEDGGSQTFDPVYVTDLKLVYTLESGLGFTIGGNNIFDEYPDENEIGNSRGGELEDGPGGPIIVNSPGVFTYSRRSAPFGFNGAFWYAGVSYDF
ncbi:MAG: TonB-dependent receptor [Pseudomonadota bacterium]